MSIQTNTGFKHCNFLLKGIENGFSMIVDFLKFCKDSFTVKNENNAISENENVDYYFSENYAFFNETLKSSFQAVDNGIKIYKKSISSDELMNKEIYLLSEVQDIISYFIEDENLKDSYEKKILFLIDILEVQIDFLDKKINILEKFYKKESYPPYIEEFVIEYNKIFEEYTVLFEEHEDIFYENFYTPKGEYEEAINETFNVLGSL